VLDFGDELEDVAALLAAEAVPQESDGSFSLWNGQTAKNRLPFFFRRRYSLNTAWKSIRAASSSKTLATSS